MERRREPRFGVNQKVSIAILGKSDRTTDASVTNASGGGLGLLTDAPIDLGSAVKVRTEDSLLLGEVVFCRKAGDRYEIGLQLDQILCGVAALSRLAQRLLSTDLSRETPNAVNNGDR
jgi:hypothetical protein